MGYILTDHIGYTSFLHLSLFYTRYTPPTIGVSSRLEVIVGRRVQPPQLHIRVANQGQIQGNELEKQRNPDAKNPLWKTKAG